MERRLTRSEARILAAEERRLEVERRLAAEQQRLAEAQRRLAMSGTGTGGTGGTGGPPAPVAPTPTVYVRNPYQANFNPADANGTKLWIAATKAFENDKKIAVKQNNVTVFMDQMKSDARKFFWSPLLNLIETSDGTKKKLLEDFDSISLEDVQKQATRIWHDANATYATAVPATMTTADLTDIDTNPVSKKQFFERMRSEMIAERIEGVISTESLKSLMLRKKEFTWTNSVDGHASHDGPTMLKILVQSINPTTRVGVSDYKDRISAARMNKFSHNLIQMLDDMESNYHRILELGQKHEDWTLHVFNAMLSAKNKVFTDYIQRKKDEWEVGEDINVDTLITDAKSKYNNMMKQRIWDKQDPKDAKIATLTTELTTLKNTVLATTNGTTPSTTAASSNNKKKSSGSGAIAEWRTIKKGDHKKVDGVDYWWCPDHKWEGHFDGLYMTHKPGAGHDEWKKKRDENVQIIVGRNAKRMEIIPRIVRPHLLIPCHFRIK